MSSLFVLAKNWEVGNTLDILFLAHRSTGRDLRIWDGNLLHLDLVILPGDYFQKKINPVSKTARFQLLYFYQFVRTSISLARSFLFLYKILSVWKPLICFSFLPSRCFLPISPPVGSELNTWDIYPARVANPSCNLHETRADTIGWMHCCTRNRVPEIGADKWHTLRCYD